MNAKEKILSNRKCVDTTSNIRIKDRNIQFLNSKYKNVRGI